MHGGHKDMKNHVKVVGKTEDGELVVSGIFKIFDTLGLPLDVIFDLCKTSNMLPSWIHFYDEATSYGWKDKTIVNRLETNIRDVYGKEYADTVMCRLKQYTGV
jgi:alanyl-tRNA synthetase